MCFPHRLSRALVVLAGHHSIPMQPCHSGRPVEPGETEYVPGGGITKRRATAPLAESAAGFDQIGHLRATVAEPPWLKHGRHHTRPARCTQKVAWSHPRLPCCRCICCARDLAAVVDPKSHRDRSDRASHGNNNSY